MLAGAVRTYLNRFAVAPGGAPWCSPPTTTAGAPSRDLAGGRRRGRGAGRSRGPRPPAPSSASAAGCIRRRRSAVRVGGQAVRGGRGRRRGRRAASALDCDLLAVSGGWSPTSTSPPISAAGRAGTRRSPPSCPDDPPAGMAVAGAAVGRVHDWREALRRRRARRRRGGRRRCGIRRTCPTSPDVEPEATGRRRSGGCAAARQGLRRLPERRHRQGLALAAARGLPLRRASQALHHARHGDRPGQDRQRQRPRLMAELHRQDHRRDRHDHASARPTRRSRSARCAGQHRGTRLPPDAPDRRRMTGPREQGAVFVEAGLWMRAQYYPRAGETDWLQTRQPRGADGALRRRRLRRLDARQDRHAGAGRRRRSSTGSMSTAGARCASAARATA